MLHSHFNNQTPSDSLASEIVTDAQIVQIVSKMRATSYAMLSYLAALQSAEQSDDTASPKQLAATLREISSELSSLEYVRIPGYSLSWINSELADLVEKTETFVERKLLGQEVLDALRQVSVQVCPSLERAIFEQSVLFHDHSYLRNNLAQLLADFSEKTEEIVDRALGICCMLSRPGDKEHIQHMLEYQPIYVREIVGLTAAMAIGPEDVFCDLGGGYGRPSLLVHLLTGARCISVEYMRSIHEVALEIAKNNSIQGVEFVNADTRYFDMSRANKFYLFNPCDGPLLRAVVSKLEEQVVQETTDVTVAAHGRCLFAFQESPFFERIVLPEDPGPLRLFHGALFRGRCP